MPYIGTSPSNGVRRVHTYTATASQTTFTGASSEGVTLSYADTNYIDVFQNGVLLGSADYTSTSGTSVVLAQGASVNDLIVIVVYDVFSVADTVSKSSGGSFDSAVTMSNNLAVLGHGAVGGDNVASNRALTVVGDTDGTSSSIIVGYNSSLAQKFSVRDDGFTTIANGIDISDGNITFADGHGIDFTSTSNSSGSMSSELFDDYEEGTWTAVIEGSTTNPSSTVQVTSARYTKVGRTVFVQATFSNVNTTGAAGGPRVTGLPFSAAATYATGNVALHTGFTVGSGVVNVTPFLSGTTIMFYQSVSAGAWAEIAHNASTGVYLYFTALYDV